MLENLIFSLNAAMPIFLMMLCGYGLRQIGWIDESFALKLNSFVFKVTLPIMLFHDLAVIDAKAAWDTRFVLFCLAVTVVSIGISYGISGLWKDKSIRGEFIQASYRSSSAILGIAFIQNIYGSSVMGPLMIIGSVPLYNICAVTVLTVFAPAAEEAAGSAAIGSTVKKTLKGIAANPIILGILVGFGWSLLQLPVPTILVSTTNSIGKASTPLGLMAMGAMFDFRKALGRAKPAFSAAAIKLVGFAALFLPLAVLLGFRGEQMVAILIMLASPTTVTSYIMARNMGHEGIVSASAVMLTTLFCSFTLTIWLFVLKTAGMI